MGRREMRNIEPTELYEFYADEDIEQFFWDKFDLYNRDNSKFSQLKADISKQLDEMKWAVLPHAKFGYVFLTQETQPGLKEVKKYAVLVRDYTLAEAEEKAKELVEQLKAAAKRQK